MDGSAIAQLIVLNPFVQASLAYIISNEGLTLIHANVGFFNVLVAGLVNLTTRTFHLNGYALFLTERTCNRLKTLAKAGVFQVSTLFFLKSLHS